MATRSTLTSTSKATTKIAKTVVFLMRKFIGRSTNGSAWPEDVPPCGRRRGAGRGSQPSATARSGEEGDLGDSVPVGRPRHVGVCDEFAVVRLKRGVVGYHAVQPPLEVRAGAAEAAALPLQVDPRDDDGEDADERHGEGKPR